MYISVLPACVCTPCVGSAPGVSKRASDPHELELWTEDIFNSSKKVLHLKALKMTKPICKHIQKFILDRLTFPYPEK